MIWEEKICAVMRSGHFSKYPYGNKHGAKNAPNPCATIPSRTYDGTGIQVLGEQLPTLYAMFVLLTGCRRRRRRQPISYIEAERPPARRNSTWAEANSTPNGTRSRALFRAHHQGALRQSPQAPSKYNCKRWALRRLAPGCPRSHTNCLEPIWATHASMNPGLQTNTHKPVLK